MDRRVKHGRTMLFLLIAGLLLYGYFYHISGQRPHKVFETSIPVSAADLIKLSHKDESLFNKEYLYKILTVRGIVQKVRKTRNGVAVILEGQPPLPEAVSCSLDPLYIPGPEPQAGDSCIIQGRCAGRLKDVLLLQCIIEK